MALFVLQYETSEGFTRSLEIEAPTVDAALIRWDRLRQPGDFVIQVGPALRLDWLRD